MLVCVWIGFVMVVVRCEKRTLDLGLDIVNGVRRLHLKGDSLTRKGLDEDLHLGEGLDGG